MGSHRHISIVGIGFAALVSGLCRLPIFVESSDDAAGAGDPLKWTRIAVVGPDAIVDRFGQIANAAKSAAPDSLTCDLGKPALDLIEPRGTGGREMDVIAGPYSQPLLHRGVFMRSVVVEHEMDLQRGIDELIDPIEEP